MREKRPFGEGLDETPLTAPLEVLANKLGLKPASELPDPLIAHESRPLERKLKAPDAGRRNERSRTSGEPPASFTEKVTASKPTFNPIPAGFRNVATFAEAGIKVNKSEDRKVAAVQFAEDRTPNRGEKDAMQDRGIQYNERSRQWEREDGEQPRC